jgi:choline dehydrogenase-like flavoprotein
MFEIRFATDRYVPDLVVVLRTAADDGWQRDISGEYEADAWRFDLDERDYGAELELKFLLRPATWMEGDNLKLAPAAGAVFRYGEDVVRFAPLPALVTENGIISRRFFGPDHSDREHDVVIIGSGMGGGLLASRLADAGRDVLVLEAGSYLFPTHVANLPRRLRVGRFDKHVWGLFPDFSIPSYANAEGSAFAGRQAFNLGGRSVFWGGLIPRMSDWELEAWPAEVRAELQGGDYRRAEDALHRSGPIANPYQDRAKDFVARTLPQFAIFDAPVAVQYQGYTPLAIAGGMFSTADLLLEDRLFEDANTTATRPIINLHQAAWRIETDGARATGVTCHDLLDNEHRTYHGRSIVLAAGTIESAKLALLSGLRDPAGLVGRGITDHPILYTHFSLPAGSPFAAVGSSAKLWARHSAASADSHPFDLVLELGADFNQGRYIDDETLARHRLEKGDATLCELVFLFNAPLVDGNWVRQPGPPGVFPDVNVQPAPISDAARAEVDAIAATLLAGLGAEPIGDDDLLLDTAALGGVAHEVGTLRMASAGSGVVGPDLRFGDYDNLYVCDNSVFASSPAANPTLTLAALALRLADRLAAA